MRDYRILWIGTSLSFIAFLMSSTAQGVVTYDLAGSNRAVGFVFFAQSLSMFVLSPFAGVIADRWPKRLSLLLCQVTVLGVYLAIGVLLALDRLTIPFIAAGGLVIGITFAAIRPVRSAYLGDIVPPEQRGNAVAIQQVAISAAQVLGPFIAAGLLAWSVTGATGTYFIMAGLYLVVVATLWQLPPGLSRPKGTSPPVLADIMLGFRHVTANPRLLWCIAGFVLVTTVGLPYLVVLPGLTKEELGAGTGALGVLLGVSAAGGLLVSLVVASWADTPRATGALLASTFVLGLALLGLGTAPSFVLAATAMFFVGAGVGGFQTLNNAIAIKESEPPYYGRVISLTMMALSLNGLVALPLGFLADAAGERAVLILLGSLTCAVTAGLAIWRARIGTSQPA